jgi:LysR family cys regulon transcriptional activator
VSFPCYRWSHLIVVPDGHPLLTRSPIRLEDLAEFPLITYDVGFTGRGHIDAAFEQAGVRPDIVLTAMDSDVIKQYVSLGLGVGIVASMAFDHGRDKGMRAVEASHLFAQNTTRLAVRKGAYLRSYAYHFIQQFAPELSRADIDAALNGGELS